MKDAEKKKKELIKKGLYNREYRPVKEGEYILLPVKQKIDGAIEAELPRVERPKSLKELYGISSFDIVGDAAIVYIPHELEEKKREIGEALARLHKNIKVVYARAGKKEGEFRITPLEVIYGEGGETLHKEYGLRFYLDPRKVFFSPRQLTERKRIAEEFKDLGGIATVFFAGIGPFAVYLSKIGKFKKIYAIEKNPDACKYMEKNIKENKCRNVVVLCGDVRDYCDKIDKADLLLMPLPKGSLLFLDCAKKALKDNGTAVIYVASKENEIDDKIREIESKGFKVLKWRRELQIAPREYRFVVYAKKAIP